MVKTDGVKWDVKGNYLDNISQQIKATVLPTTIKVLDFGDGISPAELDNMTPISLFDNCHCQRAGRRAQIHGNQIMNDLILQSLQRTKADEVIGTIQLNTDP